MVVQENLCEDIIERFNAELKPLGCMIIIKGKHFCEIMRGVKADNVTITSALRGNYALKEVKEEFLSFIR
jgi:GTP cyclohydrolase I